MNDIYKCLIKSMFDSLEKNKIGFINLDKVRNSYSGENIKMKSWHNFLGSLLSLKLLQSLPFRFSFLKGKSNRI